MKNLIILTVIFNFTNLFNFLSAQPKPDLKISEIVSPPASTGSGSTRWINFKIKNQGNANAGSSRVRAFVSANTTLELTNDIELGSSAVAAINFNTTVTTGISCNFPAIDAGPYYVLLQCDANSQLNESNENNNFWNLPIQITGTPPAPSNNDVCGGIALPLQSSWSYLLTSNFGSSTTSTPTGLGISCGNASNDVWYKYTCGENATYTIQGNAGTLQDGVFALYRYVGSNCNSLAYFTCNDDDGPGSMPKMVVQLVKNQIYYIRAWGKNSTKGTFGVCIRKGTYSNDGGIESRVTREKMDKIEIYPNPTTGLLRIENINLLQNIKLEIIDIKGKLVKEYSYDNNAIDLSELVNGVYILKFYQPEKLIIKKVVLQK